MNNFDFTSLYHDPFKWSCLQIRQSNQFEFAFPSLFSGDIDITFIMKYRI